MEGMGKQMKRCVIFGAAPFTDSDTLCSYLTDDDYYIAADGGQRLAQAMGVTVDHIIGDFDSSDRPQAMSHCTVLPVQKDDTDVLAAVRDALHKGYREFVLLGCLGGRLDHTLANMAILSFLQRNDAVGCLVDEGHEVTLLGAGEHTVPPRPNHTVSFLPFGGPANGVTIRGAAYPTENLTLEPWFPIGVSNEFTEGPLNVSIENGQCFMILSRKESV